MRSSTAVWILGAVVVPAVLAATSGAQGVRVTLPAWTEPILLDSMRQDTRLRADPPAVYAAVLKAFADLGIPLGNADSSAGIVGSRKFEQMRVLVGAPMSRSFACGESATGSNADRFRLTIAIVVWAQAGKDGGTTLGVAAAASGADIAGVYGHPRMCGSTGWVEQKIASQVQKNLP